METGHGGGRSRPSQSKVSHKAMLLIAVISRSIPLLLVCAKSGAEVENDTAPPPSSLTIGESYLEARGIAAGSIDMREFVNEASSYSKPSVPVAGRFLPEIRVDHSDNINLENYSTSPRKYQETIPFDGVFSGRGSPIAPARPTPPASAAASASSANTGSRRDRSSRRRTRRKPPRRSCAARTWSPA